MKINEVTSKIETSKPRNFVAKNATTSGAGQHKDKKKAEKQGDVKHKGKDAAMGEGHKVVTGIDRERYTDMSDQGLEGPFHLKSGKVVYYDPKEGKYYDRDSDMYMSHDDQEYHMQEDGEEMKIKSVSGDDVTIDQGGHEIKTTASALTPGVAPGTYTMKPTDPSSMRPGAQVTQTTTSEETDEPLLPIAPDDQHIHPEEDEDLMGSGKNHDIGGDPTDSFINQVRDKGFERAARSGGSSREGMAGRAKLGESDPLTKMLTIAGLR